MGEYLTESSLAALEINLADDTSSYFAGCPRVAYLHTLEAGLNGHPLVGKCIPHQVRFVLSDVPATQKEGIATAFEDAQFLFGNVRLTPMLDKTPGLRRKPVQESLQTANPTSRQQEAQTNDPGLG